MEIMMRGQRSGIHAWRAGTRILHWFLGLSFAVAYVTADAIGPITHTWTGSIVVVLLVLRIAWNFAAPQAATRYGGFASTRTAAVVLLATLLVAAATVGSGLLVSIGDQQADALYGLFNFSDPLAIADHHRPGRAIAPLVMAHRVLANLSIALFALQLGVQLVARLAASGRRRVATRNL
jgi:cytochrome b561